MAEKNSYSAIKSYLFNDSDYHRVIINLQNNHEKFVEILTEILKFGKNKEKYLTIKYFNNEVLKIKNQSHINKFLSKIQKLYIEDGKMNGRRLNHYIARSFLISNKNGEILIFWDIFNLEFSLRNDFSLYYSDDELPKCFNYNCLLEKNILNQETTKRLLLFSEFDLFNQENEMLLSQLDFDIFDDELFEYLSEQHCRHCMFYTDSHMNIVEYIIEIYGKENLIISSDYRFIFYEGKIIQKEITDINFKIRDTLNVESTLLFLLHFEFDRDNFSFYKLQPKKFLLPHNHDNYSLIVETKD